MLYLILLMLSILLSMIFLLLNHPMSMGLILMIQTILISMITGFLSNSFWFSYILFLIMVGGMLILFIYMTSLASNEKFNISKKIMIISIPTIMFILLMLMMIDNFWMNMIMKTNNNLPMINNILLLKNENLMSLNMIYNKPNFLITILLINYLLITLVMVVKITNFNQGPLRQKF